MSLDAGGGSGGGDAPVTVGQIALVVDDVERATSFYRDVVGLPFLFAAPPGCRSSTAGGSGS